MHPPQFAIQHRLSDWPDCRLEINCACGRSVHTPMKLLLDKLGDGTLEKIAERLRCEACGRPPAPVYLLAGFSRTFNYGPSPDWAVELIPPLSGR